LAKKRTIIMFIRRLATLALAGLLRFAVAAQQDV
jgi:hypothetical protein